MDAKISITTICGAKCATCPSWKEPGRTMPLDKFKQLWEILNTSPEIGRILINNVGDVCELPNANDYFDVMETREKRTFMTTNGNSLYGIPAIDGVIISFNGGTKEGYERTTGLSFERVRDNIKAMYFQLQHIPYRELDCLIWKGNKGEEEAFWKLWSDFPGKVRLSYKAENQGRQYFGLPSFEDEERIPCDYLGMLSITPDGKIISCAHDFTEQTDYGNIFDTSINDILNHPDRLRKCIDHLSNVWTGVCERCNYNVRADDKIQYLK